MTPTEWATMTKSQRYIWHRAELAKACEASSTRTEVRKRMRSKQFGVDLGPVYRNCVQYIELPDD